MGIELFVHPLGSRDFILKCTMTGEKLYLATLAKHGVVTAPRFFELSSALQNERQSTQAEKEKDRPRIGLICSPEGIEM